MATLRSANFPHHLDADVRNAYVTSYGEMTGRAADMVPVFFQELDSTASTESGTSVSDQPLMSDLSTTGQVQYPSYEEMWKYTATHKEWTAGIKVERSLIDDDQTGEIMRRAQGAALASFRTRQTIAASLFNYSFGGTNPYSGQSGGDGVSLCSASHPYTPSNASVQGNYGTSTLTYSNAVATIKLMRAFKNSRGLKAGVRPNVLVVGSGLAPEAHAIAESLGKPDSANNDINYLRSLNFQVAEIDDLDDAYTNCWWLVDLEAFRLNAIWWNRVGLEVTVAEDFDGVAAKWRAYMRCSFYVADWRAIYGHYVAP